MSHKFAGKKFTGSHTTVIDAAVDLVKDANRSEFVSKISLGIIRQCRPGRGQQRTKVKNIQAGLEIIIRGNTYVQTIYLYLNEPEINREALLKELNIR